MSAGLTTLLAVAAKLGVLLPVIRAQGGRLRRELDAVRAEVGTTRTTLRTDVTDLRSDLDTTRRHGPPTWAALRREVGDERSDLPALPSGWRASRAHYPARGGHRRNGSPSSSEPPEATA